MGLFSSSYRTYVASSVYNLAGDEDKRPDFLKTTVIGAVTSPNNLSIGNVIQDSYFNGPGLKMRAYARWARRSSPTSLVNTIKFQSTRVLAGSTIDDAVLSQHIPHNVDETVVISTDLIDSGIYTYWVDQYMLINHPDLIGAGGYSSDYDKINNLIKITLSDGSVESFTPAGMSSDSKYLIALYSLKKYVTTTVTLPNGTTTTTTTETYSPARLFIYKQNSGNAVLDELFTTATAGDAFIPFIPVRLDNKFLSDTYLPEIYSVAKAGFMRATNGSRLTKLIKLLEDNDNLANIDYAYCVFGVSLNVKEMACKEYLYRFFDTMRTVYSGQSSALLDWESLYNAAQDSQVAFNNWVIAQETPGDPLYGTSAPTVQPTPFPPTIKIQFYSEDVRLSFNNTISWADIKKEVDLPGLGKVGAVAGDFWIEKGDVRTFSMVTLGTYADSEYSSQQATSIQLKEIVIYSQVSSTKHNKITILGLSHRNIVYNGHYVDTDCHAALDDVDESPFIIPIHEDIYKNMPLVPATQMTTACSFLILNSYEVVKVKWYQKGIFKLVVIVVAILVAVYTGYLIDPFSAGMLGTNISVGASLGFTGTAAIIAGTIANAIAAAIVFNIVAGVATKAFGAEVGSIIAAVTTFLMANPDAFNSFGSSISNGFTEMMKAENLIKISDSVGKSYTHYVKSSVESYMEQHTAFMEEYNAESKKVSEAFQAQFGTNAGAVISPINFTDSARGPFDTESPKTFLSRTLLTGSDIVELTHSMVQDFSKINLNVTLPT